MIWSVTRNHGNPALTERYMHPSLTAAHRTEFLCGARTVAMDPA